MRTFLVILLTLHEGVVLGRTDVNTHGNIQARGTCDGSFADCHDEFDHRIRDFYMEEEIRIVLVGRTGEGKSSTANTIIGENFFQANIMPESVTKNSTSAKRNVQGRDLQLVDTPGLFDTNRMNNETLFEINRSLHLSAPGPHAFLIVFSTQRVTKEIKETINLLKNAFGDKMLRHSILVFTHTDDLDRRGKTIKEYLRNAPKELKDLLKECNQRYIAVNNILSKEESREQVGMLLEMVDDLIEDNDGKYFSSKQFKTIEANIKQMVEEERKAIEEEYKRRSAPLKERIHMIQKMLETLNTENNKKQNKMRKQLEENTENNKKQNKMRKQLEEKLEKHLKRVKESYRNIRDDIRVRVDIKREWEDIKREWEDIKREWEDFKREKREWEDFKREKKKWEDSKREWEDFKREKKEWEDSKRESCLSCAAVFGLVGAALGGAAIGGPIGVGAGFAMGAAFHYATEKK